MGTAIVSHEQGNAPYDARRKLLPVEFPGAGMEMELMPLQQSTT